MGTKKGAGTLEAERVCGVGAELGEGPVWVRREGALWFVNIKGRQVHRYDPVSAQQRVWQAPEPPGFIAPVRGGKFVVGLSTGLYRFDPASGDFMHFAAVEPHLPENRLNDGGVSPEGHLWFGSMHSAVGAASGSLYRLDESGRCAALDNGYWITNGPAFSPDGRVFYHADSHQRLIYAFDRPNPGTLASKRVFVQIEEGAGLPDGMTVDAEGCLWVALWSGWAVRRYSPSGELLNTVHFPCANVTKIAFGGDDARTVYATTAWAGLSPSEHEAQPLAGDLFRFRSEVPGLWCSEISPPQGW